MHIFTNGFFGGLSENLVRGLDNDEINFLDIVDKAKADAEKRQQLQEDNELSEFRERVASLQEQHIDKVYFTQINQKKKKTVLLDLHFSKKKFSSFFCKKKID